jgi:hypothetical protein
MEIYALPHPKSYFEVLAGSCRLFPINRDELTSECVSNAHLLRREAFYPGWRATVDGQTMPVDETNEIFQGLVIPKGNHRIVFTYRPSHMRLIAIAFGIGMLCMMMGLWRELRRSRSSQDSTGNTGTITA